MQTDLIKQKMFVMVIFYICMDLIIWRNVLGIDCSDNHNSIFVKQLLWQRISVEFIETKWREYRWSMMNLFINYGDGIIE